MGGVVEGGVSIADKTSPRRIAIEKVQAELRQEYDFRETRKRELEFLENGGDPLEFFKGRNTLSLSVQSTSFTGQHPDQFVSEAKGSFALTASPHGDSVESSGRLGANACEPNCADNLMLFDAERALSEGDRNSSHPRQSESVLSEKFSLVDRKQRTQEHGDSAAFCLPKKAYKRRNRSRPNRDGTRSSSTNVNLTCGSHGSSLPSLHGPTEVKELVSDAENQNVISSCSKVTAPVDDPLQNFGLTESKQDLESAHGKAVESTTKLIGGVPTDTASNAIVSETGPNDPGNQQSCSGAVKVPTQMESDAPETIQAMEEVTSLVIECEPSVSVVNVENLSGSCHTNGFSSNKGEEMKNDGPNTSAVEVLKGLDSASSCTQAGLTIDGSNTNDKCHKMISADSDRNIRDETIVLNGAPVEGDEAVIRKKESEDVDSSILVDGKRENGIKILSQEAVSRTEPALKNEKDEVVDKVTEPSEPTGLESGRKSSEVLGDKHRVHNDKSFNVRLPDSTDIPIPHCHDVSTVSLVAQTSTVSGPEFTEIDEDSILKEAQRIEAKRKRIMELSVSTFPPQSRLKSHWDYVIEEMAWLANDFAQERIWKIAAAAQISSQAAFKCWSRLQDKSSGMVAKKAAHNLARSIMEFWQSVEEMSKVVKLKSPEDEAHTVQAYAIRFMKYNNCTIAYNEAEAPPTPDGLIDVGIPSWKDNFMEENLFYPVLSGAMETYISSIESYVCQYERIGGSIQEEVETSVCDATADFAYQDNAYDGDEGETNTYDGSKSIRHVQKKRKNLTHPYGMRPYDVSSDTLAMKYGENKFVGQQSALLAKRPGGSLNVSIPTKRIRTASRRVISPFGAAVIPGCAQLPSKQDASSGDNSSFQDDQGTPYGGSFVPNSLEVESYRNFEKQLPYDSAEVSTKHKKKKKAKHLNVAYEQRWQVDSTFQNEQFQRDHLRKNYQLDSNGGSGLFTQPLTKKLKSMRQSHDNTFENIKPISGPVPSPVASQMSNMSSPNKFIKILGGRDRGRKTKVLKMPAGQPGSGSPWTLFEDQALVVLAHDLGMNWELVSDALNNTVYFKRTFRKAKECKERHNFLMDGTSADGADSAEDSGSSQPYSSTLPGIPKGSARQLFQRLQGPMEEETIKSHFEKIIIVGQRLHYHRSQNDIQDLKQVQQPHSSHIVALSQAGQNNPDGVILTPLDLCDNTFGDDITSIGYQGQHSGGFPPNQATASQLHPKSGANSLLQGSSNMVLGSNFSSTLGSNSSVRYGVPRSASFSADEQQRMHQHQMMSGRNIPQQSSPGALQGTERGVRLLPGGGGMGLVCGVNRSMPAMRPAIQGIGSSSIANSGNMVTPGMTPASVNSAVGSGQGSLMLRPREALNMMQLGFTQDQHQQMMGPDLQKQVSPRSSQGISHFGGLSSPFPKQTPSPSYPLHHQSPHPLSPQKPQVHSPHDPHIQAPANHPPNPQQQPYGNRLARERQQQQRFLQQQKQLHQPQFSASGSMISHVQSQSQLPMSSPLQNITQSQPQAGPLSPLASATSMNSMPQHQQKHPTPSQGVARNAQAGGNGLTNQTSKQRQRQQQHFSQANRQHPLQRQQLQAQQPSKVAKGVGRENPMMHQNIPIDSTSENGVSTNLGNQPAGKGEAATHLMQTQGLHTGSTLKAVQSTKKFVSPQSSNQLLPQPKVYSGQAAASSFKNINQPTSHLDNSSQNHVPASSSAMASSNHNQTPASQQKLQNPNHKRASQPSRQMSSDSLNMQVARDSDTDRPSSLSTSSEIDKMASFCTTANNATNVVQVPPVGDQWHSSEPVMNSHASNSVVSLPSNASESTPQVSQALGQRLSSGSLSSIRHDATVHWQQQTSKLQQPTSPVPQPQQNQQPLHSKQQAQLLPAGNDNLYGRAGEHRLE